MDDGSILARVFDLSGGRKKSKPKPGDNQHAEDPNHGHGENNPHHGKHTKGQEHSEDAGNQVPNTQDHNGDNEYEDPGVIGGSLDPYFMRGGGTTSLDIMAMFQKLGILFLLVFITVALTTFLFTRPTFYTKMFDPEKDEDYNLDSPDATHSSRIKKLAKVLFIFHVLLFVCFLFVLLLVYGVVLVYVHVFKKDAGLNAFQIFKDFLFTFDNGNGEKVSVSDFYLALIIIVLVGFLFYFFYFKYVLSYFTTLSYPSYIDTEVSDKEEFDTPKKFLMMYGLMIMYILAFALMVMNYVYGFPSKVYFVWNIIFLFLVMLFMGMVYKQTLKRELKFQIIWSVVFIVIVCLNKTLGTIFKTIIETLITLFKRSRA